MFIFDTGAGAMTIDPAVADELGMPELGEVLAVGVGGKTTASFRRGTRFQLGPLALEDPVYIELDLAFLAPLFGRKVAGIVGYDVLARCVAEVETRTPYVALHDPARFQLAGASWQEVIVTENTPSVRARFEGDHEGLFRIDTGADGTLSFHAPAVRELALLDGRTVTSSASGGVGGTSEAKNGRLEWFELAGHRFEKKMVQFSLAEHGAFADRYTLGNIGQEFLAPFRMVLDYPGGRIAFVPLAK
jgi:predicted aspartyl protease